MGMQMFMVLGHVAMTVLVTFREVEPQTDGHKDGSRYKVPQMGWNQVLQTRPHALWQGVPDASYFYFVHSFYARPMDPRHSAGESEYGGRAGSR